MAEAAVSSGAGALLAPAQSAASSGLNKSKNTPNSSSKDAVTGGNSSPFSTVMAEQGESSADLNSTQTVAETSDVIAVDDALTTLELIDTGALDGGQILPQLGNSLPVDVDLAAEMILAGVGSEAAAEDVDTLAFDSLIAQNQPIDQSSSQSFVIDPAVLEKITKSLNAAGSEAEISTDESVDPLSALVSADGSEIAPLVLTPVAQTPSSDVTIEQQATAAKLDLISLLDRKAKVGDSVNPTETLSADAENSAEADTWLTDSLLLKNSKSGISFNLQGNLQDSLDGALLKTTDLASAMSSKSSSSLDINALPLWRQQGVQSYASTQPAATAVSIDVPVGKPSWGDAVLDKVMWMSSQKLDSAEIALDPVDLGPMHVRISTHQDQTTVVFTSTHSQVREALDQASGQLRQSLENQGFNQVNVDVSGQSAGQQLASQAQADGSGNRSADRDQLMDEQDVERLAMASTDINKLGLIDTFV